ncbi:MAG: hypothetical protein ACLGJC_18345 [Alphaproteobacteria bacterium]
MDCTIVLDHRTPSCRRILTVITGNPVELLDCFDSIEQTEFHQEESIPGTLVGYPSLPIDVGNRVEINPVECFGG